MCIDHHTWGGQRVWIKDWTLSNELQCPQPSRSTNGRIGASSSGASRTDSRSQSVDSTKRNAVSCKCKGMFLYSSVSSPLDSSKRFTSGTNFSFSGKHSSHTAITREDYSLTFPPLSIVRYSFIQLSELGHRGENENVQTSQCNFLGWGHVQAVEGAFLWLTSS